jgi:hypothetical protein
MSDLVTLLAIGLIAGFLPIHFGVEMSLLGGEKGVRRASGLTIGVLIFRVLVSVLIILLSVGTALTLSGALNSIGGFVRETLRLLGKGVTSGEHAVLDVLLIIMGGYLVLSAFRRLRGEPESSQKSEDDQKKEQRAGIISVIILGVVWTATAPSQWLFTSSGVGQILSLNTNTMGRMFAFGVFLILSSLMLLTPILIALIWPERAGPILERASRAMNGVLRYVFIAVFVLTGAFLVWKGGIGLARYFSML